MANEVNKEDYKKLIRSVDIKDLELLRLSCENYVPFSKNVTAAIDLEITSINDINLNGKMLEIKPDFKLVVYKVADGKTTDEKLFEIYFTYLLKYSLSEEEDFQQKTLEHFVKKNVPLNVWPFARELVNNITMRMGFPPLVLPAYKNEE
ncbi:protein-export chaperone SecB [Natranaerobius trueperi]|uniref:Preprotein translocase subunit SecB n=1 Tax=Natranaerobius trueperi TaxID=759412 RepID=A0A226BWA0_9FIRM|nr:protein-export chaperone SecB [Natranaerobius trueperi]OWZ83245.1 hypothetical protein CDO51_09710 [Natranaerobius trueperi]